MSLAFATQVSLVMGFGQNFFEVLTEGGYHLDHFLGVDGFFFFPLFFFNKIINNSFHATISKYRLQRWHKC